MTFTTFVALVVLALLLTGIGLVVLAAGAALALWSHYAGSKQISPVPQFTNPLAGVFAKRRKPATEDNDDDGIPSSVRKA